MKRFLTVILMCVMIMSVLDVRVLASEVDKKTPSGIAYRDIGQKINGYMKEREDGLAACSVAVLDGQNTIYQGYYGQSNRKKGTVTNDHTVYEWGSISKLLIWVSVMQLYEEGKLDFDTDISEYLPDGFLTKRKYPDKITMLNLMNHNAGWQETTYDIEVKEKSKIVSLKKALHESEPSQIYRPNEITAYSNWGSALAAYIVERISGVSYGKYVGDRIFAPLGMKHTSVLPDCSDNPWVKEERQKLNCYSITQDSKEDYGSCIRYILLYPAGSATGTLGDIVTFAKAFTTDSKKCPLFKKENTLNTMLRASSYYGKPGATSGMERVCHGLWTMEYATEVKGHAGNTSGCSTNLVFDDKTGLTVVVMTNEVGETAFCYGIPALIYGSFKDRKDFAITKTTDIHGIYQSARSIQKGFFKYSYYTGGLFPISKTNAKGGYKLSIGDGTLTQISDQVYLFDNGNGMQGIQYLYQNEKGETYLQQFSSDYKRANSAVFWMNIILLLLCVGAIILAYISVIIIVVKLISGRIIFIIFKRKNYNNQNSSKQRENTGSSKENLIKWLRTGNLIVMMIVGVLCYQYIIQPLDGGTLTKSIVVWKCILNSILSVFPIIYTTVFIREWKHIVARRKRYLLTAILGVVVSFSIWYWQWYNFVC
ncbi:serine hydrolase domain-containing protein [Anaeromicropila herbilytica]|uniref:Beta-lactamase-related domain-containing protein n=1 Tax=Anaeromicropila herbilytica TaxID=2785025 RepID=A0A7R7EQ11_9FIRM|nr:serine hydrolase domain-containing protein [Anaeromicropila herbilytica]BCN32686.1 hypothetical protein bsdtb5_39810 [Anaeromicropila herbilytica]